MLLLPFPIFFAELFIFIFAAKEWGFWPTVGLYLAPCLLGFIMLNLIGRLALINMQKDLMQGQMPANSLLHSAALFISGVLFLVPSFFARVVAVALLLPGTRHWAVAKLKKFFSGRLGRGFSGFSFGAGTGGFGGGFQYYDFRQRRSEDFNQPSEERPVFEANVLDVKPLEIIHETKKGD